MKRITLRIYDTEIVLKTLHNIEGKLNIFHEVSKNHRFASSKINLCVLLSDRNVFLPGRGILEIKEDDTPDNTVVFLGRALRNFLSERVKNFIVFHGGAVEKGGKAVIFLGEHASGKSTLVSGFCKRGWNYLSDDIITLNIHDFRVYPNLPVSTNIRIENVGKPSRPSAALLVKFSPRTKTFIKEVEPYEILLYITSNTLNPSVINGPVFKRLTDILQKIPTFKTSHATWEDVYNYLTTTVLNNG